MKRFLCLLLVLAFLPALAFAKDDRYVGVWIHSSASGVGSRKIITYQIDENQRVYYSRQEYHLNGAPATFESAIYTCEYTGSSVRIMDGDTLFKELYFASDYCLSSDPRKTYGFYHRALESQDDYDLAVAPTPEPVVTPDPSIPNNDPCGKWSFLMDVHEWADAYKSSMNNPVISLELYLLSDGSAYMTKMSIDQKGSVDFSAGAISGIWLSYDDQLVIRVGDLTYRAYMENGILNLNFTDAIVFPFSRVDQTDEILEQLK